MRTFRKTTKSGTWYKTHPDLPIPGSVTHEDMEEGSRGSSRPFLILKKQLNFQSFPMDDVRFNIFPIKKPPPDEMISTYQRQFEPPYPSKCKENMIIELKKQEPDFLFFRKPLSDFDCAQHIDSKFLDDHFTNVSPLRRKINFFRQLRFVYKRYLYPTSRNNGAPCRNHHYAFSDGPQ